MKKLITYLFLFFSMSWISAQNTSDIYIHENGNLQTHLDSQTGIFGNLNNEGSFSENGGEVGFYNQTETQIISGINTPQFFDLIVDVPNDLLIEVSNDVNLSITFSQGRIITPRNTPNVSLNLVATDLYFNDNQNRHVDGYTTYTGNEAYTFPVGDNFRYRPIAIENNASQNTTRAAYFFENPDTPSTFSSFDRNETENNLESISAIEFWDLDGNTPTRVTLSWDIVSNINNLITNNDINELRVVGWNIENDEWEDLGNTATSGSNDQGQITSDIFIPNDYEVITFGGPAINFEDSFTELDIINAVSADGNNINDYFRIKGIENFPNNHLRIFNRWGVTVFEKEGYTEPEPENGDALNSNEVFTGLSNGRVTVKRPKKLPTGTYFYVLNYEVPGIGDKTKAGYLYLQN